jgi:hypothetical protein
VVPRVVVTGGGTGEEGGTASFNIMEALLTMLLSDRFGALTDEKSQAPRSPEAEAMRAKIRADLDKKSGPEGKKK